MRKGLQKPKGFTLIELMIVIVIVAVLVGIALPAYQNQIRKTRRGVGKGELLKVVAKQEQFFVNNKQYAADLTKLGYGSDGFMVDSEGEEVASGSTDRIYLIQLSTSSTTVFGLEAVPQLSQAKDTMCATLGISSTGVKSESGTASLAECW